MRNLTFGVDGVKVKSLALSGRRISGDGTPNVAPDAVLLLMYVRGQSHETLELVDISIYLELDARKLLIDFRHLIL